MFVYFSHMFLNCFGFFFYFFLLVDCFFLLLLIMVDYSLKVIGGHNFTQKKCIFSLDGKLLLAVADNLIRIYVVSEGSPYGTLTLEIDNLNSRSSIKHEEITNIILDPLLPDSSVISFSKTGKITFWNYISVTKTREYNIYTSLYPDPPYPLTLLYGMIIKPDNDNCSPSDLTIYHATMCGESGFIYYTTIGQIEKANEENAKNAESTKSIDKSAKKIKSKGNNRNQATMDKLKASATNIRYDSSRALNGIAIGGRNKFLATIDGNFINIINLPYSPSTGGISHKQTRNFFTCLTAHPKEMLLAAGDSIGRVYIYREDFCFSRQPIRSVTHWHSSAVADLCFSPTGSYLYSGGFESVLVRWDVSFSHKNNFYPRLGSPIKFIVCDNLNQKILTCHEDNTFHCVSSTFDTNLPALDGLTLLPPSDFLRTPSNISWDPKSSSILLKGKCGHLQFYSPFKEQQLYQLDVVNMNYLPPEADKIIVNVDVVRFCISSNGDWISTLEYREDGIMMPEMRLKFWQFLDDDSERKYKLNTCIHLPHKKPVNCMKFSRDSNFLITTSKDTEFKVWHLIKEEGKSDKPDNKLYWICGRVGNLNRVLVPEEIATSSDFSLLAISFGCNTTIWDSSEFNLEFKGTFIPPKESNNSVDQNLLSIDFGTDSQSHLLAETRSTSIRVWDLLTLSVVQLWKPPKNANIKFSFFDESTNRIGCYTRTGCIYILDMEKEIARINLTHESADVRLMVSAIFFPLPRVTEDEIFSHQGLILMDQSQKVYTLGLTIDDINLKNPIDEDEDAKLSPYARMLKAETFNMKKDEKLKQLEVNDYLGPSITRKKLIEDVFINVPSHVLPSVELFCTSFLTSMLQLSLSNGNIDNDEIVDNTKNEATSSDAESDTESIATERGKETQSKDNNNEMDIDDEDDKEKVGFIFNENYDWLKL
ncbi:WD repeat-containing protein 75-like [Panonychus citri]|uniref:WD repeat-containing protein 75-like n=1 Tax=Panonychus citri TaxID=50023 RepID=UPI002307258C|nr:WD repeat-containing protein 75-like [Panonychus citri]